MQDFWCTPKLLCQMVGTKERACVFLKISNMIDLQTNTTQAVMFAYWPSKGIHDLSEKNFNFSHPNQTIKIHFQPICAIFRGHHTPHGTHSSQTHSSIQHPNMYSSSIMQHNQRNTPVIMRPNNVFILWHLKMIQIFIWPCFTKIPFVSLCHIWIPQTRSLLGTNRMFHHKSCKYHTKITFKPFQFAHTCTWTPLEKIQFFSHFSYSTPW